VQLSAAGEVDVNFSKQISWSPATLQADVGEGNSDLWQQALSGRSLPEMLMTQEVEPFPRVDGHSMSGSTALPILCRPFRMAARLSSAFRDYIAGCLGDPAVLGDPSWGTCLRSRLLDREEEALERHDTFRIADQTSGTPLFAGAAATE
jgi:hypothetical protein